MKITNKQMRTVNKHLNVLRMETERTFV